LWSMEHRNAMVSVGDDQMTCTANAAAVYQSIRTSTGFKAPGKHYFEITIDQKGSWMVFGICDSKFDCSNTQWINSYRVGNTWLYHHDYGAFWKNGIAQPKLKPITAIQSGSVVGVLVDFDESKIIFTLNGLPQGDPLTGIPGDELFPFVTLYQTSTVSINCPSKFPPPQ